MNFHYDQYMAAARPLIAAALSSAATVGLMTTPVSHDVMSGIDHIINGVREITIGVGLISPFAFSAWGAWRASRSQQIMSVADNPKVEKVVMTTRAEAVAIPHEKVVAP